MANRVLAAIRKFFNWCVGRGLLEQSPSAGVPVPAKEKARYRTLNDAELRAVLLAARRIGNAFGGIVQLLALTGQRREEVGRLTWNQVDVQQSLWALPGEHAKNGKPHIVQLSEPALRLIKEAPRKGELVFSNDGSTVPGLFVGKSTPRRAVGSRGLDLA
jgi:integrase